MSKSECKHTIVKGKNYQVCELGKRTCNYRCKTFIKVGE